MVYSVYQFNQYLINNKLLSTEQMAEVLRETQEKRCSLVLRLIENKLLDGKTICEALINCFQITALTLEKYEVRNSPTLLDAKFITQHHILPIDLVDAQLTIAIADPMQSPLFSEISFRTGFSVKFVLMVYEELHRAITQYLNYQQHDQSTMLKVEDESAIIHYVDQILHAAIRQRASDIHFEPYEADFRIRLRIDGLLHNLANPPQNIVSRLMTRLKVMARLDIAERRLPQDGRFNFKVNNQAVFDCRVSTCPTLFGEKIVVRILDAAAPTLSIEQLGMEAEQQTIFLNALKRPQGLILVTGPTGSGKTMTLYTALNLLNTLEKNISTVEDPVEIKLAGINQVNVNPKSGFSFANALRAFLRQDPDIIMVGEIRDLETAEIALKAAQTGHLVLSTVHTNNAMATITRLVNMGIPLYQITGAISLIIAQRLIRKLCDYCKQHMGNEYDANNNGCRQCTRGYHGRIGVFELLAITETARESLHNFHDKASSTNLYHAGLRKVSAGITTLAEIQRVIDN